MSTEKALPSLITTVNWPGIFFMWTAMAAVGVREEGNYPAEEVIIYMCISLHTKQGDDPTVTKPSELGQLRQSPQLLPLPLAPHTFRTATFATATAHAP